MYYSGNDTTLQNGTVKMCCTGLSIDLLRTFSDKMKFDFDLFEVPDKAFGIQDKVTPIIERFRTVLTLISLC